MRRYSETDWWSRERVGDYLPVMSLDEPSFINYAQTAGVHTDVSLYWTTHVVFRGVFRGEGGSLRLPPSPSP